MQGTSHAGYRVRREPGWVLRQRTAHRPAVLRANRLSSEENSEESNVTAVSKLLGRLQENPRDEQAQRELRDVVSGLHPSEEPEVLDLIRAACASHAKRHELAAVAELLEVQVLLLSDTSQRCMAWRDLADVHRFHLMQNQQALEALNNALALNPEDANVSRAIEELENQIANWEEIAKALSEEAERSQDMAYKASLWVQAASLNWQYRRKGRDKEADRLFRKALDADPGDALSALLYERTLRQREHWKAIPEILLSVAEATKNRDDQFALYLRAARLLHRRLGDDARAAACYERVLDASPGNSEAMSFLVDHFTRSEMWDDLVTLYQNALRAYQGTEEEQAILLQLAMVHWKILGSAEDAAPYFHRLRKLNSANPGLVSYYCERTEEGDDPSRYLSVLEEGIRAAAEPAQRLALAEELATASELYTSSKDRAIDAWRTVLEIEPKHREAREKLKALYREAGKWNGLAETLQAELSHLNEEQVEEKTKLLRELLPIYRERLRSDARVVETYRVLLEVSPDDKVALQELAQLYEQLGRWNDLIQTLTKLAEVEDEQAKKFSRLFRVAELWIECFANYNQATVPLEAVLEVQPDHPQALERLKAIYRKKRSWEALRDVLERQLALAESDEAKLKVLRELGELVTNRMRAQGAVEIWRAAVELAPTDAGVLAAYEGAAKKQDDSTALADALERRLKLDLSTAERVNLLLRASSIYTSKRNDDERAIELLEEVLALEPEHKRATRTLRDLFVAQKEWERLEHLYQRFGDWEGLADLYVSIAEKAETRDERIDLQLRSAEVYESHLQEPQRALRSYERVLQEDDAHPRAVEALLPAYRQDEHWDRVEVLLETSLSLEAQDAAEDGHQALKHELFLVCADKLQKPDKALQLGLELLATHVADEAFLFKLEEVSIQADERIRLLGVYIEQLRETEGDARVRLRRHAWELAEAAEAPSSTLESLWKGGLEDAPHDRSLHEKLSTLYRAEQRHAEQHQLTAQRLNFAEDDSERAQLLEQLALLERDFLGRPQDALDRLMELRALKGDDEDLLAEVEHLATQLHDWPVAESALSERLSHSEGQAWLAAATRYSSLLSQQLKQPEAALPVIERMLETEGGQAVAIRQLNELRDDCPHLAGEVDALLERAYLLSGDLRRALDISIRQVSEIDGVHQRAAASLGIAEKLHQDLGDPAAAYEVMEPHLAGVALDKEMRAQVEAVARSAGQLERLLEHYAMLIDGSALPEADAAALAAHVAHLYEVELQRPEAAEPFHHRVHQYDASDEGSFRALKNFYTEAERWTDLQRVYRDSIASTFDADRKITLLLELCLLLEELLEDVDLAIRGYEEVCELNPAHQSARRALDRLYVRAGRWRDLLALLESDLTAASGPEATDLLYRSAEVLEKRLNEPGRALDRYESILIEQPTHLRAQEALERLMKNPSQRRRAAAILAPLYEAQGGHRDLVRVLECEFEDASNVGDKVALMLRIAELREHRLHDVAGAFSAIGFAVALDPADATMRDELKRLVMGSVDREKERAALLREVAGHRSLSTSVRGEILAELADLYDEPRNAEWSEAKKEENFRRLIALDPDNAHSVRRAARALAQLHREGGQAEELVADLRLAAKTADSTEEAHAVLSELADVLVERLHRPEEAIVVLQRCLDLEPRHLATMSRLEAMLTKQNEWQKLIGLLYTRFDAVDGDEEKKTVARRVAYIYETKLEDEDSAIVAYNELLAQFGPDADTLRDLAELYGRSGRWRDLLEVLDQMLGIAEQDGERIGNRLRAVRILRVQLGQSEEAVDALEELAVDFPTHPDVMAQLEDFLDDDRPTVRSRAATTLAKSLGASGDLRQQLRVLDVVVSSGDAYQVVEALRTCLRASQQLDDQDLLYRYTKRLIESSSAEPDVAELFGQLWSYSDHLERWDDTLSFMREIVPTLDHPDVRALVLRRIAQVAYHQDDRPLARQFYQKLLEQEPTDSEALDSLETLYEWAGDARSLADILQRKRELGHGPEATAWLLIREAEVLEKQLDDRESAVERLEASLDASAQDEAFRSLASLYTDMSRWESLAELYQRQLDADQRAPAELHFKLGALAQDKLGDLGRAVDEYREVLLAEPTHKETLDRLERMLADPQVQTEASDMLEAALVQEEDWRRVVALLQTHLTWEVPPESPARLYLRMGEVLEDQLKDVEAAMAVYAKWIEHEPNDEVAWEALARTARRLQRWDEQARVYASALARIEHDDESSARLSFEAARLYDERLGEPAEAIELYERAYRYDTTVRGVSGALISIHQRQKNFQRLAEIYQEQALASELNDERVRLLRKTADILESQLEDFEGAATAYQQIIDCDPVDHMALEALESLLSRTEQWERLGELLRHKIEQEQELTLKLELKHRYALVLSERLERVQEAVDELEEAVELQPQYERCIATLEVLVQNPDCQLRVIEILEPVYREAGQWKKLIAILQAKAMLEDSPSESVALHKQVAHLYQDHSDNPALVLEAWNAALREDAGDEEVRSEMLQIAEQLQCWETLIQMYAPAARASESDEVRAGLWKDVGQIYATRLNRPEDAIEAYLQVLKVEPEDGKTLALLEKLQEQVEDWQSAVKTLEKQAQLSFEPEQRSAFLFRAGAILRDKVSDLPQAANLLRSASEEDPTNTSIFAALSDLYQRLHNPSAHYDTLTRWYEVEDARETRTRLGIERAVVAGKLGHAEDAIDALRGVLVETPQNLEALRLLQELHRQERQWHELLDVLVQLEEIDAKEGAVGAKQERAELLSSQLQEYEASAALWMELLSANPESERAAHALLDLCLAHQDVVLEVAPQLERYLKQHQAWRSLVELLKAKAAAAINPEIRQDALRALAAVQENRMENVQEALQTRMQIFQEEPSHEAAGELERVAAGSHQEEALIPFYEQQLPAIFNDEVARAVALQLYSFCEAAGDVARVLPSLEQVQERLGYDSELDALLDRLYHQSEQWEKLTEVIERRALSASAPERAALLLRLANLHWQTRTEPEAALRVYQDAMLEEQLAPHLVEAFQAFAERVENGALALEALAVLEEHWERQGNEAQLLSALRLRLSRSEGEGDKVFLLRRIAQLASTLGDAAGAATALCELFVIDPFDTGVLDTLEEQCRSVGSFDVVRTMPAALRENASLDGVMRAEVFTRLGLWFSTHLRDQEAALELWREAASANPEDPAPLRHRRSVISEHEEHQEEYAGVLVALAAVEADEEARRQALVTAAELYEHRLSDSDRAKETYRKLLELEPESLEISEALIRLHTADGEWQQVERLLDERGTHHHDPAERASARLRQANVIQTELGDAQRATELLEVALDEHPQELAFTDALEETYRASARWDALAKLIERKIDAAKSANAAYALRKQLAELAEERLGDAVRACDVYRDLLLDRPEDNEVYLKLRRSLIAQEQYHALAQLLEEAAQRTQRKDHWLELVELAQQKLDDPALALTSLERALETHAEDPDLLKRLRAVAAEADDWDLYVQASQALLRLVSAEEANAYALELAEVLERELGDSRHATEVLRARLSHDGSSRTLEALRTLLQRNSDESAWLETLTEAAFAERNFSRKKELLAELLQLQEEQQAPAAERAETLAQLHREDPSELLWALKLADAQVEAGALEEAVGVLSAVVDQAPNKRDKSLAPVYHRLGKAFRAQGHVSRAVEELERAFRLDLSHVEALIDLSLLYYESGKLDDAQKSFKSLLLQRLEGVGFAKADIYFYLGDIAAKAGERSRAIAMLEKAVAEGSTSTGAVELLGQLRSQAS